MCTLSITIIANPPQNPSEGRKSSKLADLEFQAYAFLLCHVMKECSSGKTAPYTHPHCEAEALWSNAFPDTGCQ